MGKFAYALMLVIAVELALFLFGGTSYSQTSLFSIIQNPSNIWNNPLYLAIVAAIAVSVGAAIIPGNFYQLNQLGIYAGIAAILITFLASLIHLWSFINGALTSYTTDFSKIIASTIVVPLLVYYIMAAIEWMRSN